MLVKLTNSSMNEHNPKEPVSSKYVPEEVFIARAMSSCAHDFDKHFQKLQLILPCNLKKIARMPMISTWKMDIALNLQNQIGKQELGN